MIGKDDVTSRQLVPNAVSAFDQKRASLGKVDETASNVLLALAKTNRTSQAVTPGAPCISHNSKPAPLPSVKPVREIGGVGEQPILRWLSAKPAAASDVTG